MQITALRRFVAVVDAGLHFPRAADELGVPLASLYTSIEKLEGEVGHPVLSKQGSGWQLTPAGTLLLAEARERIAAAPPALRGLRLAPGCRPRGQRGRGHAPIVKGQPKPYKKRQGR